ncbi:MAG: DNA polymerase I [Longimicrobiales bacterium]
MVDVPHKTRPRLFLIDGYALIYRAFFAMISRPLTTSKGENTSAAFGFTRFLTKIVEEHEPDYLGVVMDAGTSQRTEVYPAYKATREKMPDELSASMPRIRSIIDGFRVPILELEDHEADDVIGTLAMQALGEGTETVIVSGDKDFYQLIRDGIALLNPGRGGSVGVEEEWVDERNATERLGVPPERVTDYLALIGDTSDNIPGAPGIGPKTARMLIETYGPIDEILAHAGDVKGKRARESLVANAEAVRLSKELVTIRCDLPIGLDLATLRVGTPDHEALRRVFVELEFHSLARDHARPALAAEGAEIERDYRPILDPGELAEVAREARKRGRIGLVVETSSTTPVGAGIVGIGLALEPGRGVYLPFGHRRPGELDLGDGTRNLPALGSPEMRDLVELFGDADVAKIGQNLKADLLALRLAGIPLRGLAFDTMIASYLLDPGRRDHSLDSLALEHLQHKTISYQDLCGSGRNVVPLAECEVARVAEYACEDADLALRVAALFEGELERYALRDLMQRIEMPLIPVLAEMEYTGIRIDRDFFAQVGARLARDLELIEQDIYKEAGEEFNINSTPQLREVLFDRLKLPVVKKTKTGASTDASVLEELAGQGHRLPRLLLEYRQLDKLKGTYVDALPALVSPRSGRIHTSFNQTVAATGRLSSSDPNLQNIPIRTEVGAELRKGFVPEPGWLFMSADYSQIELRILAHLSGEPALLEGFRRGVDIHRQTAAIVFDVPIEDVDARMRAAAKTINFATIYGIGPYMLSKQLGTSVAEAKEFIDAYFTRLAHVREFLDRTIEQAKERGYVETLAGRRRYVPELRSKNWNIRQFGERAATNAPVQGTAADVIKLAMIDIHAALQGGETAARMLLQVHDELVFEVPRDELDTARSLVKAKMEDAFTLDVPLEVGIGVGENWLECK